MTEASSTLMGWMLFVWSVLVLWSVWALWATGMRMLDTRHEWSDEW